MNKARKKLTKYICNKAAILITGVLMSFLIAGYIIVQSRCLRLDKTPVPQDAVAAEELYKEQTRMGLCKEVLVIAFSVIGGAWLSTLFIEKKKDNEVVQNVLVDDILTSDQFWAPVEEKSRNKILAKLEGLGHFDGDPAKSEMYNAARRKINAFGDDKQLFYYDQYCIDISCNVTDRFIEKRIVKTVSVKSYKNNHPKRGFVILSVASPKQDDFCFAEVTRVLLNGQALDPRHIKKSVFDVCDDKTSEKRGYTRHARFQISKTVDFSNKTPQVIEVEYITRCPVNDLAYTCRMPYPCKRFEFHCDIETDGYVLNPVAFGFVDDGNNTLSRADDRTSVSFRFDDWIFPRDGVCVYLEKTVAK